MPTTLQKAIGAVKDQTTINLAKVYSSSHIEVAVVRATTHDDLPVDERHIYRVLQFVSSNKIYASGCARAIGKRISRTRNWIVALKALMLVLRIFKDGDPYFPREVLQAMKKGAKILNLSDFRDESHSDPWDYTAFVRTFAMYLDERLDCFLAGKLQRRYTYIERDGSHSFKKTTNESVYDLKPSILLDRIVSWQRLLHRAIATKPTGSAKLNRLVQISLYAIVKESFDIYKDISDGLSVILNSFFHLQYETCVCAFQIYIKAAKQFEELSSFYSLCKIIDVGRTSEYPRVQTISEELIENMQQFLKDHSSSTYMRSSNNSRFPGLGAKSTSNCDNCVQPKLDKRDEVGDLITEERPFISIDLEEHSDQFEKESYQERSFRVSYTSSAQSMHMKNSTIDLLSLDDWQQEERHEDQQIKFQSLNDLTNAQQSKSSKDRLQSCSGKGWELMLAESVSPLSRIQDHYVYDFGNQQINNYSRHKESETKKGGEFTLAGPPTQQHTSIDILSNTFKVSTVLTPYNQPQPQFTPLYHYNPFLANVPIIPSTNPPTTSGLGSKFSNVDPFLKQPTFQTTHRQTDTFSLASHPQPLFLLTAHNINDLSPTLHNRQSDPIATARYPDQYDHFTVGSSHLRHNNSFATSSHSSQNEAFPPAQGNQCDPFTFTSQSNHNVPFATYHHHKEDPFIQTMNQQKLLNQPQLWLQHQHTNIARSTSDV